MKKNLYSILALGALTFGLAGCSSEEPQNIGPVDSEGIGYMSFTISSDQSRSRAEGDVEIDNEIFNNGDANEYAVCPNNQANAAFFFDSENRFYGMSNLQAFNNTGMGHDASHSDKYPEQYYTYITRWRNTNANPVPSQVLVVLNANPTELDNLAAELSNAGTSALANMLATKYETYDANGNYVYGIYKYAGQDYFTMTNSAFYDTENKTVTQIDPSQVCETAEKALANPVTVYVERVLAKYQLGFGAEGEELLSNTKLILDPFEDNEGLEKTPAKVHYVSSYTGEEPNLDYPAYETTTWKAYIVNWAVNGLEKEGYLIKDIVSSKTDYWNGYNNPSLHRSYWAESPDYATTEGFTTQYRSSYYDPDNASLGGKFFGNDETWEAGSHDQLNTLHYISFNDMKNRARYKYTAERTYKVAAGLTGYGPYRYASHYLIAAQLLFDGVDTDFETTNDHNQLTNVSDKYYAYNFYWVGKDAEKDFIRYAYRRMATQIADGREHVMKSGPNTYKVTGLNGTLYVNNNGAYTAIDVKNAADYFETQPSETIHADGKVALKVKKDVKLAVCTGEDTYADLSAGQMTAIIYNFSESARHYNKGAMYYAIPVQHNQGKSAATNTVKIDKDNGSYKLGQFGTVRNHWYRLTVSAIGSIGTPVDDPEQPIIPDPEDEYYVALEIVILPWHVIDNGSTEL